MKKTGQQPANSSRTKKKKHQAPARPTVQTGRETVFTRLGNNTFRIDKYGRAQGDRQSWDARTRDNCSRPIDIPEDSAVESSARSADRRRDPTEAGEQGRRQRHGKGVAIDDRGGEHHDRTLGSVDRRGQGVSAERRGGKHATQATVPDHNTARSVDHARARPAERSSRGRSPRRDDRAASKAGLGADVRYEVTRDGIVAINERTGESRIFRADRMPGASPLRQQSLKRSPQRKRASERSQVLTDDHATRRGTASDWKRTCDNNRVSRVGQLSQNEAETRLDRARNRRSRWKLTRRFH